MSRILLVGKGPPARDGIASFLRTLMDGLGHDHDVRLVNLTRDGDRAGGRLTLSNLTRTLSDASDVWRGARGADVVHVHSALAPHVTMLRAGLLGLMGRLRGARVVVHAHGGLVQLWLTTPARRVLARAALAPAHRVVAVSEGGRDALEAALGSDRRVVLIDNTVDTSAFGPPGQPNDPPRILFAGVLTPRKGVLDLIAASALLETRGVAHELLLTGGSPPEGDQAEAEVRAGVRPGVRLLGPQPLAAMPDLYRSFDVFCLPSWWEAMPLSVLEAMASGLPVVATRVGDVPRAVEDETTGLLVTPRDPHALADALQRLLRDPALRRRMGDRGRRRVQERFDAARGRRDVDSLYRELIAGGSAGEPDAPMDSREPKKDPRPNPGRGPSSE